MVLSPRHHRTLLEAVYETYDDHGPGWNYEMRPLSYELLRAGVVTWLDPRFNTIWGSHKALHFPHLVTHPRHATARSCAAQALRDVHFLHFAGTPDELEVAAPEPAPPAAESRPPRAQARTTGLRTPVVLLVHARPDTTAELVRIVRAARPPLVLVVADGPRAGRAGEAELCAAVRATVEGAEWGLRGATGTTRPRISASSVASRAASTGPSARSRKRSCSRTTACPTRPSSATATSCSSATGTTSA